MRNLYQARDSLEARQLVERLAAAGVDAVVLGEHLAGAAGELSALNFPTVWVVENDLLGRAQGVLAGFLAEQRAVRLAAPPAWECPKCGAEVDGELALCWRCGTSEPQ